MPHARRTPQPSRRAGRWQGRASLRAAPQVISRSCRSGLPSASWAVPWRSKPYVVASASSTTASGVGASTGAKREISTSADRSLPSSRQTVTRDCADEPDGRPQAGQRDGGVERPAAGEQAEHVAVDMRVEQRFAHHRDHGRLSASGRRMLRGRIVKARLSRQRLVHPGAGRLPRLPQHASIRG